MTPLDLFLGLLFTGLCVIILLISLLALRRRKGFKLSLITVAFVLYSILATLSLLADPMGWHGWRMSDEILVLNIGIVVSIYLAIVKG